MKIFARSLSVLVLGFFLLSALPTQAAFLNPGVAQNINENGDKLGDSAGYDKSTDLPQIISVAIRGFLGLLGVIFIVLIIVAGFNWMTAGGDEEKIKKATALIRNAVIGLLIIVSAYAITYFVFANLPGSGTGTTPHTPGGTGG